MKPFDFNILAIDFDGTLCFSEWPNLGPPNTELIKLLNKKQELGDKLILWTCRTGDALIEAIQWCELQGLKFDAVNSNIPEVIRLYGRDSRKVTADLYIDDKCANAQLYTYLDSICNTKFERK